MKKYIWNCHLNKNQSGYMLITVMLIITIISILGLSIMSITMNAVKTTNSERDDQSVYYIAESGLTVEMENIKTEAAKLYENENIPRFETCKGDSECIENLRKDAALSFFNAFRSTVEGDKPFSGFETITGTNKLPSAEITVSHLATNESNFSEEYKISSIGIIDDKERKVEQTFTLVWPGRDREIPSLPGPGDSDEDSGSSIEDIPIGTAAYVTGDVQHDGGTVIGHVGSLKCNDKRKTIRITNGGSRINGDIFLPENCDEKNIEVAEWMVNNGHFSAAASPSKVKGIPVLPAFPREPVATTFNGKINGKNGNFKEIKDGKLSFEDSSTEYTLDMNGNLKFEHIKFGHGNTLNIDTGNTDKNLVVNQLVVGGKIKNVGNGKLNIFVLDQMDVGGSGIIGETKKENIVNVLYSGRKAVNLNGNQRMYSSFYSKQANITIGGSAELTGNIFSHGNQVNINGHGDAISQVVLAPDAHVQITGSGKVIGVVFAESLYLSGGGNRIVYKEGWIDEGPIALPKPDPEPEEPMEPDNLIRIEDYISSDPLIEV